MNRSSLKLYTRPNFYPVLTGQNIFTYLGHNSNVKSIIFNMQHQLPHSIESAFKNI